MELKDRVAVVTGGSSGIGQATAILFARAGASVANIDRNLERGEETIAQIIDNGGQAIAVQADVGDAVQMEKAFQQIIEKYKKIDILFINAGINGVRAPIEEIEPEEWDKTITVNLRGTFLTAKYGVPHLKRQGGSIIINSSINGTRKFSTPGAVAYACTKAAQVTFAKMMAVELASDRIRVNVICPGRIDTLINASSSDRHLEQISKLVSPERIPLTDNNSGTSEQIAKLVLFLSSDASSFITGTEIWIDGATSLI
jgi:NAD(P)-dependent dehydrogenase (short-subunit alcohol dehydrogenase family)